MTKASLLPYYPRFIFTCSDGKCFSTADLDSLEHIKDAEDEVYGYDDNVTQFIPGQKLNISWSALGNTVEVKSYRVEKIEVRQIKRDLDEETAGMYSHDCMAISGKSKKHMMEIYVFLKAVK